MDLTAVHHIAVIGSDYARSRHFYVELLGFRVIRETWREERGDWKLDLALDGMELELFIMPGAPARPSYPEACGLRHLAFRVPSVAEAAAELARLGIPTEPIRRDALTGRPMTFFRDPDGLPLELHE